MTAPGPDALARVRECLESRGALELTAGAERDVAIVVDRAGGALNLRVSLRKGGVELGVSGAASHPHLAVRIGEAEAWGVGSGELLLERLFEEGRVTVEGAEPDDYRLAPAFELLLESLVEVGLVTGTGRAPSA